MNLPPEVSHLCPKCFPHLLPNPDPNGSQSSRSSYQLPTHFPLTSHSLRTHFPHTSHSLLRAIVIRIPEPEPVSVSPACTFLLQDQRVPLTTIKTSDGTDVFFDSDGHSQVLSFSSKRFPDLEERIKMGRALAQDPKSKRAGTTVGPPDGKFQRDFLDGKGNL